MARASTVTLTPLDTFFRILGVHPLHANQVAVRDLAPVQTCSYPLVQHSWQAADRVGREEIALALQAAENTFQTWLGFDVAPHWNADERVQFTRPAIPELHNVGGINVRGRAISLQAKHGYVLTGGQEAKTLIQAGAAIVYSDTNADGYLETATVTVATTVIAADEIAIYYPSKAGNNIWEIRPITVTITGGVATIVCRRELLVTEVQQERFDAEELDGLDNTNFLTTVDVYRHYNDPSVQVEIHSEGSLCNCEGSCVCSADTQTGCMLVRDNRNGIVAVHPATWNAANNGFDAACWCSGTFDRARMWYKAGWQGDDFLRALVYYTVSIIDRPLCGCDSLRHVGEFWREDYAEVPERGNRFQVNNTLLDNPLGTTRAAVEAWKLIKRHRIYA